MGDRKNFSKKEVIEAIANSGAIVSTIAKRLQCEWHCAKKYINKWDETIQAYNDEEEIVLDLCQASIIKSVKAGDASSAKWYLSVKGRDRGFAEKSVIEHTGKDGGAIENKLIIEFVDTVNYED